MRSSLRPLAALFAAALLAAPVSAQSDPFTWVSAGGPYAGSAEFVHFDYAILALHDGGASRTEDGGRTWDRLPDAPSGLRDARREPGYGTVFASDDGLVVTADAGRTWEHIGPASATVLLHTVDAGGARVAVASEEAGLVLYQMSGGTWSRTVTPFAPSFRPRGLFFSAAKGGLVLLGRYGDERVSADGGATWEVVSGGDSEQTVTDVLEAPDGRVFRTSYKSSNTFGNSGMTEVLVPETLEWIRVERPGGGGLGPSFGLAEAFGEVFVGTAGGAYWVEGSAATDVIASGRIREYVPLAHPASAFAGAVVSTESFFTPALDPPIPFYPRHGVYRIGPDGSRTQRGISSAAVTGVAIGSDGRVVATTENGAYRLYGSAEGLETDEQRWERLSFDGGPVYGVRRVGDIELFLHTGAMYADAPDYCGFGNAYDATAAGGALLILMGFNWYSTSGGILRLPYVGATCESFHEYAQLYGELVLDEYTGDGLPGFGLRELNRMTSGVILAGAHEPLLGHEEGYGAPAAPIYYSADDGMTWAAAAVDGDPEVYDFLTNDDGMMWAGTDDGLLLAGSDGTAWTPTGLLAGRAVYDLHRDADGAPLAGTDAGAYRFDGTAWQPHGLGLSDRKVFAFRYLADSTLVVGTDRGVWSSAPLTSVDAEPAGPPARPTTSVLGRPFPNPATAQVTVPVTLAATATGRVELLDVLGRTLSVVRLRASSGRPETIELPTADLPAGLYLIRLTVDGEAASTRRITVVR